MESMDIWMVKQKSWGEGLLQHGGNLEVKISPAAFGWSNAIENGMYIQNYPNKY